MAPAIAFNGPLSRKIGEYRPTWFFMVTKQDRIPSGMMAGAVDSG
jgi:hypothetical protein